MAVKDAYELIMRLLRCNGCAVAVAGEAGIGKSKILQEVAAELGLAHLSVHVACMGIEDLTGLPYRVEKCTHWTRPHWFPGEETDGVLVLEDFNRVGDRGVLNSLMPLFLDRQLNGHALPPGWRIAATLNPARGYAVQALDAAQLGRMALVPMEVDPEGVVAWGRRNGVNPVVLEFLAENPSYVHQVPADGSEECAWPSPRSWFDGVARHLPVTPEEWGDLNRDGLRMLASVFVGPSAAAALSEHMWRPVPGCREILDEGLREHEGCRLLSEPSIAAQRLAEFGGSLARLPYGLPRLANLEKFLGFVPRELVAGFVGDLGRKHPRSQWSVKIAEWYRNEQGNRH
jgi:hypothetical protein